MVSHCKKQITQVAKQKKPDVKAHMFASRGRCVQLPATTLKKTHVATVMDTTNTTYTHHLKENVSGRWHQVSLHPLLIILTQNTSFPPPSHLHQNPRVTFINAPGIFSHMFTSVPMISHPKVNSFIWWSGEDKHDRC